MKKLTLFLAAIIMMATSCTKEYNNYSIQEESAPTPALEVNQISELFPVYEFNASNSHDAKTAQSNLFFKFEVKNQAGDIQVIQDWTRAKSVIRYQFTETGSYTIIASVMDPSELTASIEKQIQLDKINFWKDNRDGQEYDVVEIGNLIWMAENYNYYTATSVYFNNDSLANHKDGRLYLYSDVVSTCPTGWRVPTTDDFMNLVDVVGGFDSGRKLKSTTRWEFTLGTNDVGFNALPTGAFIKNGEAINYASMNAFAGFWSTGSVWSLYSIDCSVHTQNYDLTRFGFSVRYVRDKEEYH